MLHLCETLPGKQVNLYQLAIVRHDDGRDNDRDDARHF